MGAAEELRSGWRIVLGSLCGIGFGVTGLFFYSMGFFIKPVAGEFGWSRTAASTATLVAALALAITAPFVGRIVDRLGARFVALTSSLGLAAGFFALSRSPASLPIYLSLVLLAVLLGSGASPIAYTRILNVWFDRARGTALGLAQTATGIAATLLPILLIPYLASHGWRAAYQVLGIITLVSTPFVMLLIGSGFTSDTANQPKTLGAALSLAAAVRTSAFRVLASMLLFAAIGVSGIIVHMVPMLNDAGLTPDRSSAVASLIGVGVILGRALTGLLVDRLFAPRIAGAVFAAAACGCWLLTWGGADWAIAATLLTGFAMGAEIDLISYMVACYFGIASYSSIYGWLYAVFMVGTSIGPLLAGSAFDHFGNYHLATALLGAMLAIAAAITWRLPKFSPLAELCRTTGAQLNSGD
jgi:MFS family permease